MTNFTTAISYDLKNLTRSQRDLANIDWFFSFGGKQARVVKVVRNTEYAILTKVNVAWYYTAMKILALMTIGLPLLLAKVIARSQHKIVIVQSLNKTRAAIEIGSGDTRFTVGNVDLQTNQITKILFQKLVTVSLRKDLAESQDGRLSQKIEKELCENIRALKQEVAAYNPEEWVGVATSVFRTAKNGQAVLNNIKFATGVNIHLLPHTVEGEVGFASAAAVSNQSPENIVAWDVGAGSFQLASKIDNKVAVCGAEFAFVPALEELFAIRKIPFHKNSPNPVAKDEALKLIDAIRAKLPPMPSWVITNTKQIIGIGGKSSCFSVGKIATSHSPFTKEDILEKIFELCGKTDEELSQFPKRDEAVVKLILLYSIMAHCQFDKVSCCQTFGNGEGILTTDNFWKN